MGPMAGGWVHLDREECTSCPGACVIRTRWRGDDVVEVDVQFPQSRPDCEECWHLYERVVQLAGEWEGGDG